MERVSLDNIVVKYFNKDGYKIDESKWPSDLNWHPDYRFKKRSNVIAVILRNSNKISENHLQIIGETRANYRSLNIFIVFSKKPSAKTVSDIKLYGVGVQCVIDNHLEILLDSKSFVKKFIRKIRPKKKMQKTDIFISSEQSIKERKLVASLIEKIARSMGFPLYPCLVENDPRWGGSKSQIYKAIHDNLERCDWLICVLAESFRPIVADELQFAVENYIKKEYLIVYVKENRKTKESWAETLNWYSEKNLKYLLYSSLRDLNTKLTKTILVKLERLHKKLKIDMWTH